MGRRWARIFVALCGAICLLSSPVAMANSAVTVGVGDTILSVSGTTSPNAFVTISRDGDTIGTTTADSTGTFAQSFPAQDPGLHQISIYAHSVDGLNTDTVTLSINITEHGTTSMQVFLPSTLAIASTDLIYGQNLQLNGETAPGSTVTIVIDNSDYATASSDSQGRWNIEISTLALASGQHTLFIKVADGFGAQSYPTAARSFTLGSAPKVPPASGQTPSRPTITFPQPDLVWHQAQITVRGTAGRDVQIELWDDNELLGSVWSNGQGEWSLTLLLMPKEYALRARACLNQKCSGFSDTVRFRYEPIGLPLELPLRFRVPRSAFTAYPRQSVPMRAVVLDGRAPYKATIEWGDGTSQTRTYADDNLAFPHTYAKPGRYTVIVHMEDARGKPGLIYFSVEVKPHSIPDWVWPLIIGFIILFLAGLLFLLVKKRRIAKP